MMVFTITADLFLPGLFEYSPNLLGPLSCSFACLLNALSGGFARVIGAVSSCLRCFFRPFNYRFSRLLAALANLLACVLRPAFYSPAGFLDCTFLLALVCPISLSV